MGPFASGLFVTCGWLCFLVRPSPPLHFRFFCRAAQVVRAETGEMLYADCAKPPENPHAGKRFDLLEDEMLAKARQDVSQVKSSSFAFLLPTQRVEERA